MHVVLCNSLKWLYQCGDFDCTVFIVCTIVACLKNGFNCYTCSTHSPGRVCVGHSVVWRYLLLSMYIVIFNSYCVYSGSSASIVSSKLADSCNTFHLASYYSL